MKHTNSKTRRIMKKGVSVFLIIAVIISTIIVAASAADGNVQYPEGVTEAMCRADYWAQKAKNPYDLIMDAQEIDEFNALAAKTQGTFVVDLEGYKTSYDATALKEALIEENLEYIADRALYIDGKEIDKSEYFGNFINAIKDTAWTGTREIQYGICVRQTYLMSMPANDIIGYSETDPDSEYQNSALNVNDPVIIKQICSLNGKTFYFVETDHCSGWIDSENTAICSDREEWLDAWKVTAGSKDILVVTQNRIVTEPSLTEPETADVKLTIGTTLKLVPEDKIPEEFGERYAWNSNVVYLPVRNADGTYAKKAALISQHYDVSIGFLPMTQANILDVAFTCLGDRYGWGGMLDAMDCSLFTRNVYRCFGLCMPRNTTWQQRVPNTKIDISGMSDEEKFEILKNTPAGATLYLPGHTMIYLGYESDTGYVLSALGSASESTGDLNIKSVYSVAVTPLTVRRRNGNSWLSELTSIVIPANYAEKKYDPVPQSGNNACALCGKEHTGTFGKFIAALHKVIYFIIHIFDRKVSTASIFRSLPVLH